MDRNYVRDTTIGDSLPGLELHHESGSSCVISLYGAHIISLNLSSYRNVLFCSEKAIYQKGKAIRGGIPLIFPQFNKGVLPSHGFARTEVWELLSSSGGGAKATSATFRLTTSPSIAEIWPHQFECIFTVSLDESLLTTYRVRNIGSTPFSFQSALHSYFQVGDIHQVQITGLEGCSYLDFLQARREEIEARKALLVDQATDRVYLNSSQKIKINSVADNRTIVIEKEGFTDSVVWNPWIEGNENIADLGEGDYQRFLCVESGNVETRIHLNSGEESVSTQRLSVHAL